MKGGSCCEFMVSEDLAPLPLDLWGGKSRQTCPVEGSCPLNGSYQESKQRGRIWGATVPSKGTFNFFPEGLLSQNLHYLPKVQRTKSLTHVLGGDLNHSSMVLAGQLTGTQLCARCDEGNANRFFPLQSYSLLEKSYMKRSTGSDNGEHSSGNRNERS